MGEDKAQVIICHWHISTSVFISINRMFYVTNENKTRTPFLCVLVCLFRLERCSYLFPFSWLYSKARSRCTRETFGWMNSVCAFSSRSGGGARGVAWRYNALNAFARVPAEMEGRHSSRSSDVRKRIPEVKRYKCTSKSMTVCLYVTFWFPWGRQAWIFICWPHHRHVCCLTKLNGWIQVDC